MNRFIKLSSGIVGGAALLVLSNASFAGVVGSQHDLSAGGSAQGSTANTDEVCIFCHTPHGADTTAPVPLWNKVLGAPGSYTTYATLATPSLDGAEAPIGSVSLACLSCHDGTQAMDVVLNGPGSGNYNPAGAQLDPVAIGVMTGTPVPNLGTDLTNDHPISIQYCGGGKLATDTDGEVPPGTAATGCNDADFNEVSKATLNSQGIWWVNSAAGTGTQREKVDMILYGRDEATVAGGQQPFVECGSCHDPHNAESQVNNNVAFLRITNEQSRICTTCHIK